MTAADPTVAASECHHCNETVSALVVCPVHAASTGSPSTPNTPPNKQPPNHAEQIIRSKQADVATYFETGQLEATT